LIGVLTGTGGISDMVRDILAACAKETGALVVYDADPAYLITELLRLYREEHHSRPSCFCTDRRSDERISVRDTEADPVCGMQIFPEAAPAERIVEGRRYIFCSSQCAAQFDTNPLRYLKEVHSNG
jgi:YHS domain-containing protein